MYKGAWRLYRQSIWKTLLPGSRYVSLQSCRWEGTILWAVISNSLLLSLPPVIWLSPVPHLTLNWTETWPLWLPETHPPLCPTQSPGAVSPAPSASASPGPHSPIFLRICWMAPWTSPTSISDSACVQSSFWALSSQGEFISGDALTRPTALLSCLVVSTLRCPWVFSSFIPFALSCLSGACGRKHMGFGDRTEFESQVVLPLSDCVPFHKLLQISESQFPLKSEENSTCHTGLLWGLKWKLIY